MATVQKVAERIMFVVVLGILLACLVPLALSFIESLVYHRIF
jgi:hypothetical protein